MKRTHGFGLWVLAFLAVWAGLVTVGDHWGSLHEHAGIALAMALGSYFGSSTPVGGGAVGFPVLVLFFGETTAMGRDFGFAIQSAGMVSATIYIWATRRRIAWRLLGKAVLVGALVTPLAVLWLVPLLPQQTVKLLFAVLWAGFGIVHALRWRQIETHEGSGNRDARRDGLWGALIGIVGGLVSAATGVGINMLLYMVMVLLFRSDAKIAIPTSVVAMAAISLVGISTRLLQGMVAPETYLNWLAAAPVVVLGAPLGAWMMQILPRAPTLWLVSALCIAQLVWTCLQEQVQGQALGLTLFGVLACVGLFIELDRRGRRSTAPQS